MIRLLKTLSLLTLLVAAGCQKPADDPQKTPPADPVQQTAQQPQNSSEPGITPMAGVGAGPMAPVSGAESVQGSGGGSVGSAIKEKAKNVAGSASQGPDLGQAGE